MTISVEILTMRQLLPFFGSSVLITSLIIGIFLLCLALGYWRGGKRQNEVYQQLSHNFSWALLWLGFGLSYDAVALFFYLGLVKLALPILLGLSIYLCLVLAPIVYWLGQTIPLTTRLFNQTYHVNQISGQALFLSTLGSFLGAVLTTLVLFQYLGVAWTISINCLILYLLIFHLRGESHDSPMKLFQLFLLLKHNPTSGLSFLCNHSPTLEGSAGKYSHLNFN